MSVKNITLTLTPELEKDIYEHCNSFFEQGLGFHMIAAANGIKPATAKRLYLQICEKYNWENKYPIKIIEEKKPKSKPVKYIKSKSAAEYIK